MAAKTKKIEDALAAAANVIQSAMAEIDGVRSEIAELKAHRVEVKMAPLPEDEAIAGIDRMLDHWARATNKPWHAPTDLIGAIARDRPPTLELYGHTTLGEVTSLLVPLLRPLLRDALVLHLHQYYAAYPPGLPAVERQQRLAEIDEQILALETQEVEMVRLAGAAGMTIDYRPDTSPAAILGC